MGIFIDGFEQFLGDAMALVPLGGYTSAEVVSAEGRLPSSTAVMVTGGQMTRSVPVSGLVASAGVAVRFEQRGGVFFQVQTATVQASPITGRLSLNGVSGEVIPAANRYYYYEVELDWQNQQARLYVNGRLDITSPYTGAAPAELSVSLRSVVAGETVSAVSFDDLYINDGPRLGPIEVMTQMANTDGAPQDWTPSIDDTDHAAIVGAQPPDPLNAYVQSDVPGAEDIYGSDTIAARDDTVRAVSIIALARVTATTGQVLIATSNGQEAEAETLGSNYAYRYTEVPFTAGATAGTIAGQAFGIKVGGT